MYLLQQSGHLLEKVGPFCPLVCGVLMCVCHFIIWCPGPVVVLDYVDFDLCLSFILKIAIISLIVPCAFGWRDFSVLAWRVI